MGDIADGDEEAELKGSVHQTSLIESAVFKNTNKTNKAVIVQKGRSASSSFLECVLPDRSQVKERWSLI